MRVFLDPGNTKNIIQTFFFIPFFYIYISGLKCRPTCRQGFLNLVIFVGKIILKDVERQNYYTHFTLFFFLKNTNLYPWCYTFQKLWILTNEAWFFKSDEIKSISHLGVIVTVSNSPMNHPPYRSMTNYSCFSRSTIPMLSLSVLHYQQKQKWFPSSGTLPKNIFHIGKHERGFFSKRKAKKNEEYFFGANLKKSHLIGNESGNENLATFLWDCSRICDNTLFQNKGSQSDGEDCFWPPHHRYFPKRRVECSHPHHANWNESDRGEVMMAREWVLFYVARIFMAIKMMLKIKFAFHNLVYFHGSFQHHFNSYTVVFIMQTMFLKPKPCMAILKQERNYF